MFIHVFSVLQKLYLISSDDPNFHLFTPQRKFLVEKPRETSNAPGN